jgi:CRP/FNR family transcriptional regulator, cyclic AMP receptor protein
VVRATLSSTSPDALARIPLFEGLPRSEISRLLGHLHERPVPAGTNLLVAEQPGEAVYVILTGSVKVYALSPDGTEVVLAVLGAGEILGEMSAADSVGRSASVVTLEETHLLWMDRRTFRASVDSSAILARNLAEVLSRRVRVANSRLISLASLDVPGRVASELLSLAREYGQAIPEGVLIPMRLTQADLAALVGASRVSVNQALGQFRKHELVSIGKDGRVSLRDEEALVRRTR